MKRLLALLGVIAALGGCAAPGMENEYKGADAGFLVSSVGFIDPANVWYEMIYRPLPPNPPQERRLGISSKYVLETQDYNDGTVQGHVVVHHLKPGEYEFYSAHSGDWTTEAPFSYRFTIKSGETTYVGSFIGTTTLSEHDKGFLGEPLLNGGIMRVVDEHERDMAAARKYQPNLPAISATMLPNLPAPILIQKKIPTITVVY